MVENLDGPVQMLTELGLTICEAKIYIALSSSGVASTKTISAVSKVAQQDVYRIIRGLKKMSLVEEIMGVPTKYKAVSIQETIFILLNRKAVGIKKLKEKTESFLDDINKRTIAENIQPNDAQFILIPEGETNIKKRTQAVEAVERTLDLVTTYRRFFQFQYSLGESTKKLLKKGGKLRVILNNPEEQKKLFTTFSFLKSPLIEIRYSNDKPDVIISLCDEKILFLAVEPKNSIGEESALWSNNPSLVKLAKNYFECLWVISTKKD